MKTTIKTIERIKENSVLLTCEDGKTYERKYFDLSKKVQKRLNVKSAFAFAAYFYPVDLKLKEKIEYSQLKQRYTWDELNGRASEKVEKKQESKQPKKVENKKQVKHEKFNQIKTCVELNIPVYLAGPAGSGKNHTLEQVANELGLDFYFTNSVQQEFKLTGFIDAGGKYHETEFYKAFTKGGIFFLDEMDASIPEVLVLLNAAIANGYFEFPNGKVTAHKNFRVVAAGNTVGQGADEDYTGRMVLDQATLDRFAIIDFDYSRKIEMLLAKDNSELVSFIRGLRKKSKELGIRATFSYRCISMVTKLEEAGMDIKDILKIAVFKGMDKDTIRTYEIKDYNNKYYAGLAAIQ